MSIKNDVTRQAITQLSQQVEALITSNAAVKAANLQELNRLSADLAPLGAAVMAAKGMSAEDLARKSQRSLVGALSEVTATMKAAGVDFKELAAKLEAIDAAERKASAAYDLNYRLSGAKNAIGGILNSVANDGLPLSTSDQERHALWEDLRSLQIAAHDLADRGHPALAAQIESTIGIIRSDAWGDTTLGAAVDDYARRLADVLQGKTELRTLIQEPVLETHPELGGKLPEMLRQAAAQLEAGAGSALFPYLQVWSHEYGRTQGEKQAELAPKLRAAADGLEAGKRFDCPGMLDQAMGSFPTLLRIFHNLSNNFQNDTYLAVLGPGALSA